MIRHRVSIAVSEAVIKAVLEAVRETANVLIRLQLPLNAIAEATKLSLEEVKSIKAEIDGTKPVDPPK
jgi:hypothetical protein